MEPAPFARAQQQGLLEVPHLYYRKRKTEGGGGGANRARTTAGSPRGTAFELHGGEGVGWAAGGRRAAGGGRRAAGGGRRAAGSQH